MHKETVGAFAEIVGVASAIFKYLSHAAPRGYPVCGADLGRVKREVEVGEFAVPARRYSLKLALGDRFQQSLSAFAGLTAAEARVLALLADIGRFKVVGGVARSREQPVDIVLHREIEL